MDKASEAVTLLEEAIAQAIRGIEWNSTYAPPSKERLARAALRVVLDTKTTCETCGGHPYDGGDGVGYIPCPTCEGSGFGPPAVDVARGVERIGETWVGTYDKQRHVSSDPAFTERARAAGRAVEPVYRFPEHTVEEGTPMKACKFCGSTEPGPIGSDGELVCADCAGNGEEGTQ